MRATDDIATPLRPRYMNAKKQQARFHRGILNQRDFKYNGLRRTVSVLYPNKGETHSILQPSLFSFFWDLAVERGASSSTRSDLAPSADTARVELFRVPAVLKAYIS